MNKMIEELITEMRALTKQLKEDAKRSEIDSKRLLDKLNKANAHCDEILQKMKLTPQ